MKMQSCDQNESQVSTSSMMFCNYIDADTNNQKTQQSTTPELPLRNLCSFCPNPTAVHHNPNCQFQPDVQEMMLDFFETFLISFGVKTTIDVCVYMYMYICTYLYIYMIYIYAYTHTLFLYHTVSYYILIHMYHPFVPLIYSHDMLLRLWRPLKKVSSSYHFNNKNTCYC